MDKNFDYIIQKEINKPNALFFDIGAGQAESINRFKKILPNCIIHSFEPVKARIKIIEDWLKAFPHNNNITLNHNAIGEKIEGKADSVLNEIFIDSGIYLPIFISLKTDGILKASHKFPFKYKLLIISDKFTVFL